MAVDMGGFVPLMAMAAEERRETRASRIMENMIGRVIELWPKKPNVSYDDPEYNVLHDSIFALNMSTESLVMCLKCAELDFFGESVDEDDEDRVRFVLAFQYSVDDIRWALQL